MEKGREEGIKEGMEKGVETKALGIAKNMLEQGFEIKIIQKVTGLSREVIEKLIDK